MSGYSWHPKIKMIPDNGSEIVFDMRSKLTDASGPVRHNLRNRDESEAGIRDVNFSIQRVNRGIRSEVIMRADIATMADQAALATVVNRLLRDDWDVQLSLDAGVTYRSVEMSRAPSPVPFRGKTIGGASFLLGFRAKELMTEWAEMDTDPLPRQVYYNEDFELFSPPTPPNTPTKWVVQELSGTWDSDTADARNGKCLKSVRTDALNTHQVLQEVYTLEGGQWNRVGGWMKSSASYSELLLFRLQHVTTNWYLRPDLTTWSAGTSPSTLLVDGTTDWVNFEVVFQMPETINGVEITSTEWFRPRFYHDTDAVGTDMFLDDFYWYTNIVPPGVATW